jgi:hypothetical protein
MIPALRDAKEFYQKQIDLANDRVHRLATGEMKVGELGPPQRNTTAEAIESERSLIAQFQRGIDIIERVDA